MIVIANELAARLKTPVKVATERPNCQKSLPRQATANVLAANVLAANEGEMAAELTPRRRSSRNFAEPSHANLGFKSGTTRINLRVPLSIPKFVRARRKW